MATEVSWNIICTVIVYVKRDSSGHNFSRLLHLVRRLPSEVVIMVSRIRQQIGKNSYVVRAKKVRSRQVYTCVRKADAYTSFLFFSLFPLHGSTSHLRVEWNQFSEETRNVPNVPAFWHNSQNVFAEVQVLYWALAHTWRWTTSLNECQTNQVINPYHLDSTFGVIWQFATKS